LGQINRSYLYTREPRGCQSAEIMVKRGESKQGEIQFFDRGGETAVPSLSLSPFHPEVNHTITTTSCIAAPVVIANIDLETLYLIFMERTVSFVSLI
jgi:hypothetical protein